MKVLSLIFTLFISVSVFAAPEGQKLSVIEFVKALDIESSKNVPKKFHHLNVDGIHVSDNNLFFRIKGFPINIEFVSSKNIAMKVNGVAFSRNDLKNFKTTKKQVMTKFKLKQRRFSLIDLLFDEAHAIPVQGDVAPNIARMLVNSGANVQFGSGPSRQSEYGGYFQRRRQRTFPSMAALITAVNAFNGSEGASLMASIMGAADNYRVPYQPMNIEPFKLSTSSKSSN